MITYAPLIVTALGAFSGVCIALTSLVLMICVKRLAKSEAVLRCLIEKLERDA